jgi:hypothetical protein
MKKVHAPIGLDLGAETSEEIAMSVVAEIQMVFTGHSSLPLREKKGPIHERKGQQELIFRKGYSNLN